MVAQEPFHIVLVVQPNVSIGPLWVCLAKPQLEGPHVIQGKATKFLQVRPTRPSGIETQSLQAFVQIGHGTGRQRGMPKQCYNKTRCFAPKAIYIRTTAANSGLTDANLTAGPEFDLPNLCKIWKSVLSPEALDHLTEACWDLT